MMKVYVVVKNYNDGALRIDHEFFTDQFVGMNKNIEVAKSIAIDKAHTTRHQLIDKLQDSAIFGEVREHKYPDSVYAIGCDFMYDKPGYFLYRVLEREI